MNNDKNGKSALVIIGGAYQSTYYSGALQALDEMGIARNFDSYFGISAGSIILTYFLSGQLEFIPTICEEYVPTKKLYNPRNILSLKKPILNLDYLVDDVFSKTFPVDIEKIKNSGKEFIIPIMHHKTGDIKYANINEHNIFDLMKATMSIPWLTRRFYEIDGEKYVDPGIADQVILNKIIKDGYSKVLILVNNGSIKDISNWKEMLIGKLFFIFNPALGKMAKYLLFENINYQKELDKNPNIVTISPSKFLLSKFENDKDKMRKSIELGYSDVMNDREILSKLEIFK